MITKHSQAKNRRFLYFSVLAFAFVLGLSVFVGWAGSPEGEGQVRVKVVARGFCGGVGSEGVPLAGVEVNVGGASATTGADGTAMVTVSSGKHDVTATVKGYNITAVSWEGNWLNPGLVQLPDPYCTTRSVEAEFKGPKENTEVEGEYDEKLTVGLVCDSGCKETGGQGANPAREIALAAVSEDCKDFNDWESSKIIFGPGGPIPLSESNKWPSFPLDKYGVARTKTELRPGIEYKISFYNTHFSDSDDALTNPNSLSTGAQISKIEVYRAFPKLELVGTYPADKDGFARVSLDSGLWEDNSTPYLKVYVGRLCDVGYATIEFVNGEVELTEENLEPRPAQAGIKLFRNDMIKTGPGSKVQLKSLGGIYTITIGEDTRLNIGAVTTGAGRKFIEADIKAGKIQIQRAAIPKPPPQPTPDPNLPPLPAEPMPVIVKTRTLEATDKQTNYTVSHDENTGVTTVGVEEGEVEVTPTNPSLRPFTLAVNQQVRVTENGVSAITPFYGSGSKTGRILLYVGIGVLGLVILVALYYFFRRQHRLAMRPAYYPAGANPPISNPAAPVSSPTVNQSSQRCPNPLCGKTVLAGKPFCAHCGTSLNV